MDVVRNIFDEIFDEANKDKEPIIKSCKLHNCDEMIEYVDSKNGVDVAIVEDFLTFIVYGQGYFIDNISYQTQTGMHSPEKRNGSSGLTARRSASVERCKMDVPRD